VRCVDCCKRMQLRRLINCFGWNRRLQIEILKHVCRSPGPRKGQPVRWLLCPSPCSCMMTTFMVLGAPPEIVAQNRRMSFEIRHRTILRDRLGNSLERSWRRTSRHLLARKASAKDEPLTVSWCRRQVAPGLGDLQPRNRPSFRGRYTCIWS
jgi:hypothetical protein